MKALTVLEAISGEMNNETLVTLGYYSAGHDVNDLFEEALDMSIAISSYVSHNSLEMFVVTVGADSYLYAMNMVSCERFKLRLSVDNSVHIQILNGLTMLNKVYSQKAYKAKLDKYLTGRSYRDLGNRVANTILGKLNNQPLIIEPNEPLTDDEILRNW